MSEAGNKAVPEKPRDDAAERAESLMDELAYMHHAGHLRPASAEKAEPSKAPCPMKR